MSEKSIEEAASEGVTDITIIDNGDSGSNTIESETVIGAENDGGELVVFIDSDIQ